VSKSVKIIIGIIIAVVVVGGAVAIFALQPRESVSDSVLTEVVERRDVTTTVAASGVVTPVTELQLSFAQTGPLATVEVSVGDVVEEGDLLATLEEPSGNQFQRNSEDYELVAPMSGTVVSIASEVGEFVAGGPFIVLADLTEFLVTADFAEADVVGIEEDQEVTVTFDAIAGVSLTGTVSSVGLIGRVDPAGGRLTTYEVTITLPDTPEGLRAGMTAQASITTESRSDVLAAPVTALIERGQDTFVQVLAVDGTLTALEVTVGIQGGYWIEITSGLSGGERVVTGSSGDIPVVGGGGFGGPPEGTPGGSE
jgi:HlyD family secretion protein